MRILQINKFWYPHGGADGYAISLAEDLKRAGHEIAYFGMHDERNIVTGFDKYFVSTLHSTKEDAETRGHLFEKLHTASRVIYSHEAAQRLDALLRAWRPDVAHLHNIYHHLSPSILGVLKRHAIPTVQTLHDYKRMCPNHAMFTQGSPCERCKGRKYWNAVRYRCVFDAVGPSAIAATEMSVQSMFGWYDRYIDHFIAPSAFMKTKLQEWGQAIDNVTVLPTGISQRPQLPHGDRVVFVGRISEEKGVAVLIRAARETPTLMYDIVGDGPQKNELARRAPSNVIFHGRGQREALSHFAGRALCAVAPSIWYENYPLSVLEMMAWGKAVVGSNIGGIPELIDHGRTGLLVPSGDAGALAKALLGLQHDRVLLESMGRAGRHKVQKENDHLGFIARHESLYARLIDEKKRA